jgi:hypothetical protein
MASQRLENELLGLEKQYWQALKDNDVDAALRLTDDPCIVAGPQGVASFDKVSFERMMRGPSTWKLRSFELGDDAKIQVLGDDVAVLAYQVHEELIVDGKPVTLDASESSTWVRRDGRWVCAMHAEAIKGDPFGRDRRAAAS